MERYGNYSNRTEQAFNYQPKQQPTLARPTKQKLGQTAIKLSQSTNRPTLTKQQKSKLGQATIGLAKKITQTHKKR